MVSIVELTFVKLVTPICATCLDKGMVGKIVDVVVVPASEVDGRVAGGC